MTGWSDVKCEIPSPINVLTPVKKTMAVAEAVDPNENKHQHQTSKPIIVNAITFQTRNLVCVERSPLKVRSPPIPPPAQRGKRFLDLWSGFIGREITSGGEKGWVAINLHILWGRKVKRGISRLFTFELWTEARGGGSGYNETSEFSFEKLKIYKCGRIF